MDLPELGPGWTGDTLDGTFAIHQVAAAVADDSKGANGDSSCCCCDSPAVGDGGGDLDDLGTVGSGYVARPARLYSPCSR